MQRYGMAGRHRSKFDPALAERVRIACSSPGNSISRLAHEIGVWPSTLSRSVNDQRFSKELRAKLDNHLPKEVQGGLIDRKDHPELQHVLLLLQELGRLIPDLHQRLLAALDPQARLGQTAD